MFIWVLAIPGIDMDENGYPDVVVGAYDSSKTLLLRSRPVIKITAMMQVRTSI